MRRFRALTTMLLSILLAAACDDGALQRNGTCTTSLAELRASRGAVCPESVGSTVTEIAICRHRRASFGRCMGKRTVRFDSGTHSLACNYDEAGRLVAIAVTDDVLIYCGGTSATIQAGDAARCDRAPLEEANDVRCQDSDGGI